MPSALAPKKITVPPGMLEAVDKAIGEMRKRQASRLASRDGELWPNDLKHVVLEAALTWILEKWKYCMFLMPDLGVPDAVKDLLYDPKDGPTKTGRNDAILEAFRRGRGAFVSKTPTLTPPNPGLTIIARLYLELYPTLEPEDRKIYRGLIHMLANPTLVISKDDGLEFTERPKQ